VQSVVPHRHCKVCGSPTPPEDRYCSTKCAQVRATQARQQRFYTLIFAAISVILVIVLVAHP
jgi:predicted nucleic acid-binding Zn ribbon protein